MQCQAPQRLRRVAGDYVSPPRVAPGTRATRPPPWSLTAARRPTTRHTRRVWSLERSHVAELAAGGTWRHVRTSPGALAPPSLCTIPYPYVGLLCSALITNGDRGRGRQNQLPGPLPSCSGTCFSPRMSLGVTVPTCDPHDNSPKMGLGRGVRRAMTTNSVQG